MQTPYKIGILGATGMVGQRFIQLLENHPWFQVTWLAASDRSSGKRYEEAVRWKLDTPIPASVAKLPVSPATPEQNPDGVPEIIFAALDTDIARELEPKFAAAGCAVISNSSAFRMQADVPLVIPEVNADHLALIAQQNWNGANKGSQKRGYIVTNPNCSAIGLVMALKPLAEKFGLRSVFVSTMQAVSGAGYPGVPSLDILGNVVPFIKNEEEKLEAETRRLLGKLENSQVTMLDAKVTAHCNRVAVEDGHTESVSIELIEQAEPGRNPGSLERISTAQGTESSHRARAASGIQSGGRSSAATAGPHARARHGCNSRPVASLFPAGLEVYGAVAQYDSRSGRRSAAECGIAGVARQIITLRIEAMSGAMKIVVMKFGGTSVESPAAIARTAEIVESRRARGLMPVVVVSAMAKVTDQLLAAAAAAERGDRTGALAISSRLRNRHLDAASAIVDRRFRRRNP